MTQRLNSLNNYLWNTGNTVTELRLLIEGAIVLYEGDALPLVKLANDSGCPEAACAFDTIGAALYELRRHIIHMQQEHTDEVLRQCEDNTALEQKD